MEINFMERHFHKELESLKTALVKMGSVVEENVSDSIRSVIDKSPILADRVIETDLRVDALEIEIDNAIVDLLALQQPVASDLRFILAAIKINNDLERISDHAVNIAQSAQALCSMTNAPILDEIPQMALITKTMLKEAIDSFILQNPAMAQKVLKSDDQIDDLNRIVTMKVIQLMKDDNETVECDMQLSRISRNLERIADLTTNIAEDVLFHTQARVVKHHAEEREIKAP
jgi:phosphate transport system protein